MSALTGPLAEPIAFDWKPLSQEHISGFESATLSAHTSGEPPTLVTLFRWGEFQWLERMKVDMRQLLHTEQEYEYLGEIPAGKPFRIVTRLSEVKDRRGMKFVSLHSEISCEGTVRVQSQTRFVVRTP